jgi:hypothetical protein
MSSPRHKKPELNRHDPVRHFAGVFGSSPNPTAPSPEGAVSRGVEMGYRVIEQYMRQGQTFAQAGWPSRSSDASPTDPQKLTERMFQYASDLAGVWLEYAQAVGQASPSPASPGPARPAPAAPHVGGFDIGSRVDPGSSAVPPRVSIDVVSRKRVELTVDLKPGAAATPLRVFDLRAGDPALPRISGVTIEALPQDHRVVVRIELPDDQPAGVYAGVIVDLESNVPHGTLSVRVFDSAGQ